MIKIIVLLFVLSIKLDLFSQQYKSDNRLQILKEDSDNQFKSDLINNLDLLEALNFAGISINKFDLGVFDKTYQFLIIQDEYKDGKIIKTDTIFDGDNNYHYYVNGEKDYYTAYIDQIKVFTELQDTTLLMEFSTYGIRMNKIIQFKKINKNSFYNLRRYVDTKWKLNEKIPFLVFASSWEDKRFDIERFCGVSNLSKNDKGTEELLNSSPHYYVFNYITKEIE